MTSTAMKTKFIVIKSILLPILFVLSAYSSMAQHTLKGTLTDSTNNPVEFALISVTKNDSTQASVAETFTDSAGNFMLDIKDKGAYHIHSIIEGYADVNEPIQITDTLSTLSLHTNVVKNMISGVTITAQLPTITRKIDRIVMNVENNPIMAGKSSIEALALAPGVFVRNGSITINGNIGARVMVNNKLLQLSGDDLTNYLTSLRAEEIKSIEVIAHPPAEYDAEGSGGLINIILKKQTKLGLNGSVYVNYKQGRYAGTNEGGQLNFKKGKISLAANYSYNYQKSFNILNQERNFPNDGIYNASNRAVQFNSNQYLHTGITYDINDAQYIALDYTRSWYDGKEHWSSVTDINYKNNPANNLHTQGLFPNAYNGHYNDIGLNYHFNTDSVGSNFTLLADYITNTGITSNHVESSNYNGENVFLNDTAFRNATPSDAKIFTADAKYMQVLNGKSNVGFGAKLSATDIKNAANFEYRQAGDWYNNDAQNFMYNYKENIIAGFVNYTTNILKTDIQIGLRGENTSFTGTLAQLNNDKKNSRTYFGLFPSIYVKKNMDSIGNHSITLSYNRRLNRPDFNSLDPHVAYIDNYTSGVGNPYLTPQYINAYEINYTFKNKYNLSASYSDTRDIINNVMRTDVNNTELMIQQPINSGNKSVFSLTAFIPVNITKWWATQNTIQYNHEDLKAPEYHLDKNIFFIQTNQDITLPHQFKITFSAFYMSNFLFANAVLKPLFAANIAVQKKVLKDKLMIRAGLDDIFNSNKVKGEFFYNNFNLVFNQKQQSQVFSLGLVYNFSLGKAFRVHNIESSNDEEKGRLGK